MTRLLSVLIAFKTVLKNFKFYGDLLWNISLFYQHVDCSLAQTPGTGRFGKTLHVFDGGVQLPFFDRILLAKENLVENIPLAEGPFLRNFKEFVPKYSLGKRNFPKTDDNLAPKRQFLGFWKPLSAGYRCHFQSSLISWVPVYNVISTNFQLQSLNFKLMVTV